LGADAAALYIPNHVSRPQDSTAAMATFAKQQLHAAAPSSQRALAPVRAPALRAARRPAAQHQPFTAQRPSSFVPQQRRQLQQQQQQQWHRSSVLVRSSSAEAEVPPEEVDFDLLSNKIADMQEELVKELNGCSIFLVGMMGSGKSTVGRMLANTLKYAFFDTDSVIEMAHKPQAVAEIFSAYGEDYFRQCETQVLKELSPYKNLVVSTGGWAGGGGRGLLGLRLLLGCCC
jgi:shikimate kinase